MLTLSFIFGCLSIFFYGILYFPQIYKIISLKSSNNLSIMFLIWWCLSDLINLIAVILLKLNVILLIIGWYHTILASVLLAITLYYKDINYYHFNTFLQKHKKLQYLLLSISIIILNLTICSLVYYFKNHVDYDISILSGTILAWFSLFIFSLSRFSQIYINNKFKETYELSTYTFMLSILGNLFYIASILIFSIEKSYIFHNLPQLSFAGSAILFDIIIIIQILMYS